MKRNLTSLRIVRRGLKRYMTENGFYYIDKVPGKPAPTWTLFDRVQGKVVKSFDTMAEVKEFLGVGK